MAELNQVRDGRKGHAFVMYETGEVIPAPSGDGASPLKKGHFYYIVSKGAASGFDAEDEVGDTIYISDKSKIAMKTGDSVKLIDLAFLGFANEKSLSESKNTNDVTCDKDDSSNFVSDGITTTSGNVNGYNLMREGEDYESKALNAIKASFHKMVIEDAAGVRTVTNQTNKKFMLMFNWDSKDIEPGEHFSADIVPCFLTQNEKSGSYGSGSSMNLSYQGCDSDEYGHQRMELQAVYVAPEA